jgi:hypothetical protein
MRLGSWAAWGWGRLGHKKGDDDNAWALVLWAWADMGHDYSVWIHGMGIMVWQH